MTRHQRREKGSNRFACLRRRTNRPRLRLHEHDEAAVLTRAYRHGQWIWSCEIDEWIEARLLDNHMLHRLYHGQRKNVPYKRVRCNSRVLKTTRADGSPVWCVCVESVDRSDPAECVFVGHERWLTVGDVGDAVLLGHRERERERVKMMTRKMTKHVKPYWQEWTLA